MKEVILFVAIGGFIGALYFLIKLQEMLADTKDQDPELDKHLKHFNDL